MDSLNTFSLGLNQIHCCVCIKCWFCVHICADVKYGVWGLKGVLWDYEYVAASDISHENTQLNKFSNGIKQSYIGVLEI